MNDLHGAPVGGRKHVCTVIRTRSEVSGSELDSLMAT